MRAVVAEVNRVAVRPRANGAVDADPPIGAADVFNYNRLSKVLSHPLGNDPPDHISRAAGRSRHDHGDGTRRIGLRTCIARDGWERSGAGCETQKLTTRKI
jgi:hypothetical protein